MAEEECVLELERLREELDCLLSTGDNGGFQLDCTNYCSRFCESVKERTGRWHVPLPQLQVLRTALRSFSRGTTSFPSDCEPVQYTLSSLALSFFELLLFFGKAELLEDPLRDVLESFQECYSRLERHDNVHLLLLRQVINSGGPWEHPVLQGILRECDQPKEEVEKYLSSEVPVFFEFRVRYLLSCSRMVEAMAMAKCCMEHPGVGKHLYFHQAYLTCLWKASQYDHLHKGLTLIDGRDAVEIICNSEGEEKDELLLALCRAFLSHQLHSGDMYYLWDLIFIWSKLYLRANPSKQDFLQDCRQLMLSASNVRSIFPFMKVIRAELGNEGVEFCVELCARALQTDLHHDPMTTCLIYKTIAYLLPNDLEICRACALLVFFQERTVESYKTVYLLYTHPDQEYHVDSGIIKNGMRFEILQILKKGLFFDPEFLNLITLRTNCLKLMSEKVLQDALKEIVEEDKWIPNNLVKEPYKAHYDTSECCTRKVIRKPIKSKPITRRIVVPPEVTVMSHVKRRGRKPGSRVINVIVDSQMTTSFRGLDTAQENPTKPYGSSYLTRPLHNKAVTRRGRKPRQTFCEAVEDAQNGAAKPAECLGNENLPPLLEANVPELPRVEMNKEIVKAQDVAQEQAENILTPPSAGGGIADEIVQPQEAVPIPGTHLADKLPASPVHRILLETSLADNKGIDAALLEEEAQVQLPTSVSQPEPSEVSSREREFPPESENVGGSGEKSIDCSVQLQDGPECSALPCVNTSNILGKSAINIDYAVILEMHNYCKILSNDVNDEVPVLIAQPAALTCVQPDCSTERLNSAEDVLQEATLYHLSEKGTSLQMHTGSKLDSPSRAAGAKLEGLEEVILAEPGEVLADKTVRVEKICETPVDVATTSPSVENENRLKIHNDRMNVSNSQADACHDTDKPSSSSVAFLIADSTTCSSASTDVLHKVSTCDDRSVDIVSTEHMPSLELKQGQEEMASSPKMDDTGSGNVLVSPPTNVPFRTRKVMQSRCCKLCNKDFRVVDAIRHAVAHLQKNKLKCMFCGKGFNRGLVAKRHVAEHIENFKTTANSTPAHTNRVTEILKSLPLNNKHKRNSAAVVQHRVSSRKRQGRPKLSGRAKNRPAVDAQHRASSCRNKGVKTRDGLQKSDVSSTIKAGGSTQNGTAVDRRETEAGNDKHCCPADGCSRTFGKGEQSMTRHAIRCHPFDVTVIKYAFQWKKGKCQFCQRQFKCLDHFQNHMKRHDHPLKHACYHRDCKDRFKTWAQLRDHMKGHQPLQVQCGFAGCSQCFCRLFRLYAHEQQHYLIQEASCPFSKAGPNEGSMQFRGDQKLLQSKGELDFKTVDEHKSEEKCAVDKGAIVGTKVGDVKILSDVETEDKRADGHVNTHGNMSDRQLFNGHARNEAAAVCIQSELKVVESEANGLETGAEDTVEPQLNEPHQKSTGQVQNRAKPDDRPSYGGTSNKPFMRPPPTAYLDERYISMPKRRKSLDVHVPSCMEVSSPCGSQRQRCTNCFSSFASAEALQNHLSSNKCKALFGFDSDEESAW